MEVVPADPASPEVAALVERHLAYCRATTSPEAVFATDGGILAERGARMVLAWLNARAVGIGAIVWAEPPRIAEIKSMHVTEGARGSGAASAILARLMAEARDMGAVEVRLETGSQAAFAAARALYEREGFTPCGAVADDPDAPTSAFYRRAL